MALEKDNKVFRPLNRESEVDSIVPCPSCDELFYFRKTLIARNVKPAVLERGNGELLPTDLTADQQEALIEIASDDRIFAATTALRTLIASDHAKEFETFSRSAVFPCPKCFVQLQILMQVVVLGVVKTGESLGREEPQSTKLQNLSDSEQKLWDALTKNGFVKNFFDAGTIDNPSMGFIREKSAFLQFAYLKNWFRRAVPKELPREQLAHVMAQYGTRSIDCFTAQGVVAILADGYIKCLLPKSSVFGHRTKMQLQVGNNETEKVLKETPKFEYWVKTRWGYTLGRGLHYAALQQECVGLFGGATRSQRNTTSGLPRFAEDDEQ